MMDINLLLETCACSVENLEEMNSCGIDAYGSLSHCEHTRSAVVWILLRDVLNICMQRERGAS
jgi:hypothetical protein